MNQLKHLIEESGFEGIGEFDPKALVTRQEVRDMCIANSCDQYGKSWACPPAIPGHEEYQELFFTYAGGFVFQTVAQMEDDFDYESIEAAQKLHAERFEKLSEAVKGLSLETMLFAAGSCKLCNQCTYPDNPCVHPEKVFPSLEACGLVVSEVCELAQVPYYHGRGTVAFIGGALCR